MRISPRGYLHDSPHSRHPSRQPRFCGGSQGVLLAQNAFLAPEGAQGDGASGSVGLPPRKRKAFFAHNFQNPCHNSCIKCLKEMHV